eukprot:CAMPEP_0172564348 /NCGR_PEP_ID=MMETSP1067-20121228/104029_1 /TAXON_ID=265564 ORGANISM="Thalassiosira punctigera, Strain Tpunct2005C2" /NCGR_SAMPLE_ID=MMETSP1067 /ASSEMBLY_ACC=CAM_ASM_000444 /LENGTH=44 /DNA_ID= /DNA_START= /DNA_END= /DNA_ORIENTATION=
MYDSWDLQYRYLARDATDTGYPGHWNDREAQRTGRDPPALQRRR